MSPSKGAQHSPTMASPSPPQCSEEGHDQQQEQEQEQGQGQEPHEPQQQQQQQQQQQHEEHKQTPQSPLNFCPLDNINISNARATAEERERQKRRAEENAAFVKMLEEQSLMLQDGRAPSTYNYKQRQRKRDLDHTNRRSTMTSSTNEDDHGFQNNDFPKNNGNPVITNRNAEQQQQQQQQQQEEERTPYPSSQAHPNCHRHSQNYLPHHSLYPQTHDDNREESNNNNKNNQTNQSQGGIPVDLELPVDSNPRGDRICSSSNYKNDKIQHEKDLLGQQQQELPRPPKQSQQQQQDYGLNNLDGEEMRRSNNSGEDHRHRSQLHPMTRQPPRERYLSQDETAPGSAPRYSTNTRDNDNFHQASHYPPDYGNKNYHGNKNVPMSLEEAIHNLELEDQQKYQQRRELIPSDDYDALYPGGGRFHNQHNNNIRASNDEFHYHPRNPDYHVQQRHNIQQQEHYHRHQQPYQHQHPQDLVHNDDPYRAPRDHYNYHRQQYPPQPMMYPPFEQPAHPPERPPPQRLVPPVEMIEFPMNWDGREIEPTHDNELLDRDEEAYYRRRLYRQQQQQQQIQQQIRQSHSLSPTPPSSQRPQLYPQPQQQYQHQHQQFQPPPQPQQQPLSQSLHGAPSSRGPVRRMISGDSRESQNNLSHLGGFGTNSSNHNNNNNIPTDMYSQTLAVGGRRIAPMHIEVSPGVTMPFRGSEETWEAIALNRIVRTECLGCSIPLYCVQDAELVVCPDCQTMSPAHAEGSGEDPFKNNRSGLGLGFKEEQLVQWRHA